MKNKIFGMKKYSYLILSCISFMAPERASAETVSIGGVSYNLVQVTSSASYNSKEYSLYYVYGCVDSASCGGGQAGLRTLLTAQDWYTGSISNRTYAEGVAADMPTPPNISGPNGAKMLLFSISGPNTSAAYRFNNGAVQSGNGLITNAYYFTVAVPKINLVDPGTIHPGDTVDVTVHVTSGGTGLSLGSFSVTGGTLSNLRYDPDTGDYTVSFTHDGQTMSPTLGIGNGAVTISRSGVYNVDGAESNNRLNLYVQPLDSVPPAITGPSGSAGDATSAISVEENQVGVAQMLADEDVTWSITGGADAAMFQIAPDGTISFNAEPDFEQPGDSDANNSYEVIVTARDTAGNVSSQTITVTVANVDDTAPNITGPSGAAGAPASAVSVLENLTDVTRMVADEEVSWSITGGTDAGSFEIAPDGTISFRTAPDFERPGDADTNNSYELIVTATDAAGNVSTQTVNVVVGDADEVPPRISGPTEGAGSATSAVTVSENQVGVTRLLADEAVSWSIADGVDGAKFQIAADGTITFRGAPDFERPGDVDTNNDYLLVVAATDAAGNVSTQTVTVTVRDVDDTPPMIWGPNGVPGAATSGILVNENQTGVARMLANEAVTWSITGGADAARFQIALDGTISFRSMPDFEHPDDADANNIYVLTVTARDAAGNISTQTITVTLRDIDDTAPLISGPGGAPGAETSQLSLGEGVAAVTTFTANEVVTWSIEGGSDAAKFQIDRQSGALSFLAAPDYENPTDSDHNNSYVVRVKATDAAGNVSYQTLTVTTTNVDEIARKLGQIGNKLRSGLRNYATRGLGDMLGFNEALMRGSKEATCVEPQAGKPLSGSAHANQDGGNVELNYASRLTACGRAYQVFVDSGLSFSKRDGQQSSRLFASFRVETNLGRDLSVGLGLLATRASDKLAGFENSSVSDKALQLNLYSRYQISKGLRTGAFVGVGRASYDFGLSESDGLMLNGSMTGKRQIYGWMLSGDFNVGETKVTTDAVISHARENLGNARLAAQYMGEDRSNIAFTVGSVDVTRISVPATAPINLAGNPEASASWSQLLISSGLLCEDNQSEGSDLRCGYQLGAKLLVSQGERSRFYADTHWESVAGLRRAFVGLGYSYRVDIKQGLELAVELNRGLERVKEQDNRALISLRLSR